MMAEIIVYVIAILLVFNYAMGLVMLLDVKGIKTNLSNLELQMLEVESKITENYGKHFKMQHEMNAKHEEMRRLAMEAKIANQTRIESN